MVLKNRLYLSLILHVAGQKQTGIQRLHQILHLFFQLAFVVWQIGHPQVGPA
jgi:hypothetical protein